jgi:class 3 adenylate cyclase
MTKYNILRAVALMLRRIEQALRSAFIAVANYAGDTVQAAKAAAEAHHDAQSEKDWNAVSKARDRVMAAREAEADTLDRALERRDARQAKLNAIRAEVI